MTYPIDSFIISPPYHFIHLGDYVSSQLNSTTASSNPPSFKNPSSSSSGTSSLEAHNLVSHHAHGRVLLRTCADFGGLCDHRHVE